jgi:hypothetical protein
MSYQATKSKDDFEEDIYESDNLVLDDKRCSHFFYRVAANRVECKKCGIGFMDAGDFPIQELNDFYSDKKNQDYFKSI